MRMPALLIAAATAFALAAPLHAKTIAVAAGEGAQTRLQEALIVAEPGDVVQLGAGRFVLTDGLSLDVKGVTVRGAGMDATVLDFSGQKGAGEGLLVTSDEVTLRDFAVENTKGDGIKSKGADNIVYYRLRVTWTGGPKETNGAYGIYPVSSTGVLVDGCKVSGASDAGIYVGQSKAITVRYNYVEQSVAGIEIENSRDAVVTGNFVTRNTGGILVFDLPNLPVMGGGNTLIESNLIVGNDTPNFAPKGNIVASVPRGTGVMVMANDGVFVVGNQFSGNPFAQIVVVTYPLKFTDKTYNPYPRRVGIGANVIYNHATEGAVPDVMWDGLGGKDAIIPAADFSGLNLNLPAQGAGQDQAKPSPVEYKSAFGTNRRSNGFSGQPLFALDAVPALLKGPLGAPDALDARARP